MFGVGDSSCVSGGNEDNTDICGDSFVAARVVDVMVTEWRKLTTDAESEAELWIVLVAAVMTTEACTSKPRQKQSQNQWNRRRCSRWRQQSSSESIRAGAVRWADSSCRVRVNSANLNVMVILGMVSITGS